MNQLFYNIFNPIEIFFSRGICLLTSWAYTIGIWSTLAQLNLIRRIYYLCYKSPSFILVVCINNTLTGLVLSPALAGTLLPRPLADRVHHFVTDLSLSWPSRAGFFPRSAICLSISRFLSSLIRELHHNPESLKLTKPEQYLDLNFLPFLNATLLVRLIWHLRVHHHSERICQQTRHLESVTFSLPCYRLRDKI